ncbi:acyl transferase/acyl hydrolase/lysophospholipase [Hypoxylon argillaceum]|nr:acyl transferase/acyl hydrolase/lysophospholipase [Hypoxylon argillaceum]
MPERNLRLLSLDGGGVHGLSSLIILQQLMSTINRDHPPKPCDYFDLIGGTSTGGIIALMLGRLRMGIDECIDAYVALSDDVFKKRRHRLTLKGKIQGRFDKLALEKAIKLILVQHGFNENELLRDNSDSVCKVAVYAACKETGDAVCFKSYQATSVNSHLFNSTKIWEACRATSAATSFFDPITIGPFGESFVNAAAVGINNPVYSVWNEAQEIWSAGHLTENLNCFVSIGTGMPGLKPFKDNMFDISKTLAAIATETEKTAERFRCDKFKLVEDGLYYRFSVIKGLETVGLQEAVKKAEIAAATLRYIQSQEVFRQFEACVLKMSQEFQGSLSLAGVPITQNFVPRSADTAEMERVLLSDRRFSEQTVYVLYSLGGMGKTTLAADFVRKHHTKFSAVFWLDGRNKQNLTRSIAMCAIRIPDQAISEQSRKDLSNGDVSVDVVLIRVMSWLEKSGNSSWLLVFDNVDKDAHNEDEYVYDLSRYFPPSHGSILATTRLSRLAQLGSSRRLDKAKDVEARSIFGKWYGSEINDENINRLLRELDGLPLALAQAAAYLGETRMEFADYLLYYKEQWRKLMGYQENSILCHANRNIATTWLISLQAIQAKNPASINLLRVWAFLDNKSMFYGLLGGVAKASNNVFPEWLRALATDKLRFIEATRLLLSYSMIEMIQGDSVCYSVHPVVHRCAAEVDITKPEQLEFLKIAISLVGLAVPETKNSDYWTVSRKLLPHATLCSQLLLSARDRLVVKSTVGSKHLSTIDTVNNLGVLCQGLGKLNEAESMCVKALQGREQLLGPDHMATLGSANNLALVYLDKDKLEKAENLFRRAFEGLAEVLGLAHLSTLRVWANLGLVYTRKGDFNEAEATLRQVLKEYETTIGPDHTYTLRVVNSLGHIFEDQGRLAEAEEMYTRALTDVR